MKTARYKIISDSGGSRYQFFCGLSGALICETPPVHTNDPESELEAVWEKYGQQNFELCHKCGEWVSSVMYNADIFECVRCSPWEDFPRYCPHCGKAVKYSTAHCKHCGKRLQYGND